MIIEKLQQFAEAVSVRLYVKRPAPMEQDWRLNNWVFPCFVAIPAQDSETVQETSGRVERRDFELMALRSVDVTFDTAEADAETEIARTEVLDFAQQIRGVFHVEHLGGRQIWDSANGELVVGWSLRLRLTELVGESACGGEPDPNEIEITENGTYNVLPFGRAVVDVQGGSPAVVEPLSVTPDYDPHMFTPSAGVDGFAPVEVAACPIPETDVLNVTPDNEPHQYLPDHGIGFSVVNVGACPVCPTPVLQAKTATPATTAQVVTADVGYDGLSSVNVEAVTAAIDANIVAGNIKKDVNILGVVGTMEPKPTGDNIELEDGRIYTTDTERDTAIANTEFQGASYLVGVQMNKVPSVGQNGFYSCTQLKWFIGKSVTQTLGQSFNVCTKLEEWRVGTMTDMRPTTLGYGTSYKPNLRLVEVGQDTAINLPLDRWTATNVIAEGQSGIDELNYNIKTYIADKVADRTGLAALTVTFGASLYNVLTADTIQAFTSKNWSVASA